MKTIIKEKKLISGFILAVLLLLTVLTLNSQAVVNTLPAAVDGVITLTEDVTLTEKYVISEGTTLKIDLNGYTLTGTSSNYTIENKGNLTIVDNGITKGKIVGVAPSSSCIRNLGTLKVEGVTIESAFIAIKNDVEGDFYGNLTVKDSTLLSSYSGTDTGTVMNWGKATIENSTITASSTGVAVYPISGYTTAKNSETTINDTILEGKYAVYSKKYDTSDTTTQTININDGEVKGRITATPAGGSDASVKGNVKVSSDYLSYVLAFSKEGANIILTTDLSGKDITVPEGVTLTIPEGVTYTVSSTRKLVVNGDLRVEGKLNAGTHVPETNTYFATLERAVKFIGEGKTIVVLKDLTETNTAQPYADKDITIDLNGHTVTANIINVANTTMTIKDSSEAETGKLDGTITNNGILSIESGNYTVAPVTADGATTTLNGGTYPIEDIEKVVIPENKEIVKNADGTYSIVYKSADYSKVDELIQKVDALSKEDYKDFSEVEAAVNAVIRGKNITQQSEVDSYADAIEAAINNLEKKVEENSTNNEEDDITPPATGDYVIIYAIVFVIATATLVGVKFYTKKK